MSVALESCKLFHRLPPQEMGRAREAAREIRFPSGRQIFSEGDSGDGLYIVKDGHVQISVSVSPSERRVFSRFGPGDFFGEMAVIDSEPRSATAIAEKDSVLFFIPRDAMLDLLATCPKLALELVREFSNRMREFNRQYVREVLQAERLALVGRFARSIVHDIKNPLNIIGLAAELASMETATLDSRRTVKERIHKQVDRISTMVNEILEFTHTAQTSTVLAMRDYAEFVTPLVEEIRPETLMKSVTIEVENEAPHVRVSMNPKRLSRVFFNLIHNATDAMPEGGKILVRFEAKEAEVVTEIEDTGRGIPQEIADRLFEAFVTFGKAHGTGMGLSICKKIVEDHHGRIWARNRPGGGAIFAFTIPTVSN